MSFASRYFYWAMQMRTAVSDRRVHEAFSEDTGELTRKITSICRPIIQRQSKWSSQVPETPVQIPRFWREISCEIVASWLRLVRFIERGWETVRMRTQVLQHLTSERGKGYRFLTDFLRYVCLSRSYFQPQIHRVYSSFHDTLKQPCEIPFYESLNG